jgi:diguanylate cyclase (GGDEF)-like protein
MLEKLALTDALTGLPNRRAMDRLARAELRRRARYPGPLAVGVLDVDHFKQINSTYLLPGGDQVLIDLASTLVSSLRTVDSVARIGGEEFLILAPETSHDGARILAERIRLAVQQSETIYKHQVIHITVSIGFAVAETHLSTTYEQLKHIASAALDEAKLTGRNRCVIRSVAQPVEQQVG